MSKSLAEALGAADHDESPSDDDSPDYEKHGVAAVEAFISAVASKDAEGAWDALKTAVSLCGHDDQSTGDDGGHAALMLIPHK